MPILSFNVDTLLNDNEAEYSFVGTASPYSSDSDTSSFIYNINGTPTTSNTLLPSAVGLGNHIIEYVYVDALGCTDTIIDAIEIDTATGSFVNIPTNGYCIVGDIDTVWAIATNADTSDGVFTVNGTNISISGLDSAEFDPTTLTAGSYAVTYDYIGWDGNTPFTLTDTIKIVDLGSASITSLETGYCLDAPVDSLYGFPNAGGSYAFTSTAGLNSDEDTAWFSPFTATVGLHTIEYTYTEAISGCQISTTQQTEVYALPVMSFAIDPLFNVIENTYNLVGAPDANSTTSLLDTDEFFGPGVTGDNFDASSIGSGNYTIFYTYTDSLGCDDTTSVSTTIEGADGAFYGLQQTITIAKMHQ